MVTVVQDEENFEMDPVEYTRTDLEGADKATRRRAAAGLVNGLCAHFLEPVTEVCPPVGAALYLAI